MSHCRPDRPTATVHLVSNQGGEHMSRLTTAALAVAVAAVDRGRSRPPERSPRTATLRIKGTCTTAATSKLKLSAEDGGIEVEFEVDQNRNGVPWRVTLRRNGVARRLDDRDDPGAERLVHRPPGRRRHAGVAGSHRRRRDEPERRHLQGRRLVLTEPVAGRAGAPPAGWRPIRVSPSAGEQLDVTRVGEERRPPRRPSPTAPRRPRSRTASAPPTTSITQ